MINKLKLEEAKQWLGERYILHPANHIKKGSYKAPDTHRVDVAKTFARIRKQLAVNLQGE